MLTENSSTTPVPDPFARFGAALRRAVEHGIPEPTAMALATADAAGRPAVRMVLLKEFDAHGFVFYTNVESRKGRELAANPFAALCFHWTLLEVQIRIEGAVAPVSEEEADAYFASRARGSQLGAWASRQSARLGSRAELEEQLREVEARFASAEVPRPAFWSGYRLAPERIEFWQGRASRLHEREVYTRAPEGGWRMELLYP